MGWDGNGRMGWDWIGWGRGGVRCGGKARRDGMKRCVVRRDQTGETGWVGLNIVQAKILVHHVQYRVGVTRPD